MKVLKWKCKVGYSNTQNALKKVTDVEYIDEGFFTICVNDIDINVDFEDGTGPEAFNFFNSQCNYEFMSPLNYYSRPEFKSFVSSYLPLVQAEFPRMFETSTQTIRVVIMYIPSLNRIIEWRGAPEYIYEVLNDGTLISHRFRYSGNYLTSCASYQAVQLFISEYNGTIDTTKLKSFSLIYRNIPNIYIRVLTTELSENSLVSANFLFSSFSPPDIIDSDNPYEPGGDSGEGGGGGTFDDDSDPIPDSSLPTLSSASTGFTRIYNPTLSQLNQLATYLWTDESIIQTIWNHAKQFFEDPMSVIIGLNIVPVPVPNGGTENFRVLYIDTGIPLTYAASQFVDVDCGTLEIKRYYGSALDQAPYTKISCFLPFIGTVQLNTDEVMGAILQVKYRVDICSGSCVAKIFVGGNCIYQYSGHCAINVPVSSADFSSYVSAAISVAKLAIGAAAGGAMGALVNAGKDPIQQTNNTTTITTTNTERNPATGRQITMGTQTQTIESVQQRPTTMASFSGLTPANISNTVGEIMTAKPHVEHSGSFSGNTGYLGVRRPFVIIERPNMCMPKNYQQFNGFPCMITLELAECTGFTRVQQVQLTGMSATNPEQSEILELLKSGVII